MKTITFQSPATLFDKVRFLGAATQPYTVPEKTTPTWLDPVTLYEGTVISVMLSEVGCRTSDVFLLVQPEGSEDFYSLEARGAELIP